MQLTGKCVQAAFNLGSTVDTEKAHFVWPDGVQVRLDDHFTDAPRVGAKSKLRKLMIDFQNQIVASVYPNGKVEVSRAPSETAAQEAAEIVRKSLLGPQTTRMTERDFADRITQIIATCSVLPKVINKHALSNRLHKRYSSGVDYEPENRHCVRLLLNQGATEEGVSKGRIFFEFFHRTIVVRGVGLGAGGLSLMQERLGEVFEEMQPINEIILSAFVPKPAKPKQQVPDARDALDKAIKKMLGGGPLKGLGKPRPGGFIARHLQIQEWLREKHPEVTLPDYDYENWKHPGRTDPQVWAGTDWAVFWTEHMCPVFDEMLREKELKRKRDELDPAEDSKPLHLMADSLIEDMTQTESSADAASRFDLYGGLKLLEDQLALDAALREELELPADQVDDAGEPPQGAYRSLGSGDDKSAGARRATAGRIPPWPGTARRRSYAGVEVLPGKKLKIEGEVNEAPYDVASRVLQALRAFASGSEMTGLNDECMRICKLVIAR
jgi:hypothetical protein